MSHDLELCVRIHEGRLRYSSLIIAVATAVSKASPEQGEDEGVTPSCSAI